MHNVGMKRCFLAGILVSSLCSSLLAQQIEGIRRFSEVNPHLYRGGQPTLSALKALAKLGVVTVLDLRAGGERGVAEERQAKALGMDYINVPLNGLYAPPKNKLTRSWLCSRIQKLAGFRALPAWGRSHRNSGRLLSDRVRLLAKRARRERSGRPRNAFSGTRHEEIHSELPSGDTPAPLAQLTIARHPSMSGSNA